MHQPVERNRDRASQTNTGLSCTELSTNLKLYNNICTLWRLQQLASGLHHDAATSTTKCSSNVEWSPYRIRPSLNASFRQCGLVASHLCALNKGRKVTSAEHGDQQVQEQDQGIYVRFKGRRLSNSAYRGSTGSSGDWKGSSYVAVVSGEISSESWC